MVLHGENAEQSEVNLNMTVARAFKSVLLTISVADVHILFQHPEPLSDCCDPRKPGRQSRIVQEPSRLNDFNVLTSSSRRHPRNIYINFMLDRMKIIILVHLMTLRCDRFSGVTPSKYVLFPPIILSR